MKTWYEVDYTDIKDLQDGSASKKVKAAISIAVGDGLVMVERKHKLKYFVRGGAASMKTHPTKITWRTGELAKSYERYFRKGEHHGYYGSTLKRAALLEYGDTITSNRPGGSLAIPTAAARVGVGGSVSPRDFPKGELFMGGNGRWLARDKGNGFIELMFWLVKSVYVPPRPTVQKAAKDIERPFELMMAKKVAKAMEKS